VRIEFVKESLTFTGEDSPMANLMLSVMGAFAIGVLDFLSLFSASYVTQEWENQMLIIQASMMYWLSINLCLM
jgi:hypothetical protein